MFVLAVLALVPLMLMAFIAIVIGLHRAHPTDLSIQRPGHLAPLASRIVGLHVRRADPAQAAWAADRDAAVR